MGILADAIKALVPSPTVAVGAAVPTWQVGNPLYQQQTVPFIRGAREGYGGNEVCYAAIEELCTSAAEPRYAAYASRESDSKLDDHDILTLLDAPNPWSDRFGHIATTIMHLMVAGNAYWHKERSAAGQVVELWALRPDRMRVIPDAKRFVSGYRYELGDHVFELDAKDVIHFRLRNPFDDFYGLPPLAVIASRVDSDNMARAFVAAFFRNAGVPSGMLNVQRRIEAEEKDLIRARFRNDYGGPGGWHNVLVIDQAEASYTPMGLPLGERGLVLPELDEIGEARIAMVFGVPLELIGARLSMRGQRSAAREAQASFWDDTLVPLYRMLDARINADLVPEFAGIDHVETDLSTVKAMQEDTDALHTRVREDLTAGIITVDEARQETGRGDMPTDGMWAISTRIQFIPVGEEVAEPVPTEPPPLLPDGSPNPAAAAAAAAATPLLPAGKTAAARVRLTRRDIASGRAWAKEMGLDDLLDAEPSSRRNGKGH